MTEERLFVAVDPPSAVRDRLRAALGPIRRLAPKAKWVDVSTLHVTLAFLGNVEVVRVRDHELALRDAAARHAPLELRIASAGTLGGRHPRVLWAGITGDVDALAALQRDLVAAVVPLGFVPEDRAFVPHLTLARARNRDGDPCFAACVDALADADFGAVRVDEIVLYKSVLTSAGPIHTPVATLPLRGP